MEDYDEDALAYDYAHELEVIERHEAEIVRLQTKMRELIDENKQLRSSCKEKHLVLTEYAQKAEQMNNQAEQERKERAKQLQILEEKEKRKFQKRYERAAKKYNARTEVLERGIESYKKKMDRLYGLLEQPVTNCLVCHRDMTHVTPGLDADKLLRGDCKRAPRSPSESIGCVETVSQGTMSSNIGADRRAACAYAAEERANRLTKSETENNASPLENAGPSTAVPNKRHVTSKAAAYKGQKAKRREARKH